MRLLVRVVILLLISLQVNAQSKYGGIESIKGNETGFFHVEKINDKWWCIDPSGNAFYAIGTDHVNYNVHWCEALGYAPYAANIRKIFNNDESAWAKSSTDRLKNWGFNLLGANNSPSTRGRGLAFTELIGMGSDYSSIEYIVEKTTWTGFPDVFSPGFAKYCAEKAINVCEPLKDSPWVFGWFIDNELEWFGKSHSLLGLANETIARPAQTHAKIALIEMLKGKYPTISDFNKAWSTDFLDWNVALEKMDWNEGINKTVDVDKQEFVRLCAEKYFSVTTSAIRNADPNHMVLGCRFAGTAPDVLDIAGKYCDIFTINYYGSVDLENLTPTKLYQDMQDYYKKTTRPLMITEWSFPALDAGLPSTEGAGMRVKTQADKAKAFEVYQTAFFEMPFFVGSNYFMWVDEPELGIAKTFPENSNYGLVDVNDNPWEVFTKTVKRVNEKAYRIHRGESVDVQVTGVMPTDKGLAISLYNDSPTDLSALVDVKVNGVKKRVRVHLPSKRKVNGIYNIPLEPGGHYVDILVDPEGILDEVHRGNNRFRDIVFIKNNKIPASTIPICIGPGDGTQRTYTIPLADIVENKQKDLNGIALYALDGKLVEAYINDLDLSDTITQADELIFKWQVKQDECAAFYVKIGKEQASAAKLITGKKLPTVKLDLGRLSVEKTSKNGALLDSLSLEGKHIGTLDAMMQQISQISYWERADKLENITLWDTDLYKMARVTVSKNAADNLDVGPFAYTAVYELRFNVGEQWFTSTFVSVKNTDKRPWKLGRYFHYPTSQIGEDPTEDQPIEGQAGVLGWMNKSAGLYYGAVAPAGSGISMLFWKDPDGARQHGDVFKELDVKLKTGATYKEKPSPVYLICADETDYKQVFEKVEALADSYTVIKIIK